MQDDIVIEQPVLKKKWPKILLVILICTVLVASVGFVIWKLMPKEEDRIAVKNSGELGLSEKKFDEFRRYLLSNLEQQDYITGEADVTDVVVREGSVRSFTEKSNDEIMKITSFLVDIDSLRQTFRVKVYDYTGELKDLPVMINCPEASETKYPDSECNGVYGSTSKSIRNNLPYEMKLTTGEKVLVKSIGVTRDGQQLVQVYLYSCGEDNPPAVETEQTVKNWVEALGDPAREYYTYNIRTGYCEGDAI
ncbi:hypothetical protein IKG38_01515 [Candidatus Saccharibacteria bacterium]|nr:hypothetical protein [Candidatus Saccharibacteria bacterium]